MQLPTHVYSRLENFRTRGSFGEGAVRQQFPSDSAPDLDRTIGSTVVGLIQADEQDGVDLATGKVGEVQLDAPTAKQFGLGEGEAGITAHLAVTEENDPIAEVLSSENTTVQRFGMTEQGHSAVAIFPQDEGFVMQGWFVAGDSAWQETVKVD